MKKIALFLFLAFAFIINVNAGLIRHTRKDFEKEFPDHYPGRICLKDGSVHEFPAVRIWHYFDEEIWAWTNIEEFNKVTFNVKEVEWVEVWNAKAPEKKYRCFLLHKALYSNTYILIKEVNGFQIISQYCYFAINDSGDIQYHTFVSRYYNGNTWITETKGLPDAFVYNTATDDLTWGFGRYWEYGKLTLPKNIGSRMKAALKGDKALQKETGSVKDWSLERIAEFLSRFTKSK